MVHKRRLALEGPMFAGPVKAQSQNRGRLLQRVGAVAAKDSRLSDRVLS